ncbi:hypothetical protein KCW65_21830, partial [Mycobacterium tuberculosis]|nr:hypothetical protein [Mycobacterium tuberculosis]
PGHLTELEGTADARDDGEEDTGSAGPDPVDDRIDVRFAGKRCVGDDDAPGEVVARPDLGQPGECGTGRGAGGRGRLGGRGRVGADACACRPLCPDAATKLRLLRLSIHALQRSR